MNKGNALAALKKAQQAMAIVKSDYSLKDFLAKFKNTGGVATLKMTGIKSKYVGKYDRSNTPDGGSKGFRTELTIIDPEDKKGEKRITVATFSNAAHDFYALVALFKGWNPDDKGSIPQIIEIDGLVNVAVSEIPLDGGKSTYNFDIIEEGSTLNGLQGVNLETILLGGGLMLGEGRSVDTSTGEVYEVLPAAETK